MTAVQRHEFGTLEYRLPILATDLGVLTIPDIVETGILSEAKNVND